MLVLVALMLALGLADIAVSHLFEADGPENAIEWDFALLMMAWFALLAAEWRRTGVAVRITGARRH